jgi:outer membrane biosynthesis protein TonB
MPPLLSYSIRLGLAALLLLGLAAAHVADYARLIEPPAKKSAEPTRITRATVDEAIDQYIKGYTFDAYRNVFERSNFEVNPPPPPPKPKPVKIVKPEPPPPPPPPPPKPKPFTANLEVTGIAITPERKLRESRGHRHRDHPGAQAGDGLGQEPEGNPRARRARKNPALARRQHRQAARGIAPSPRRALRIYRQRRDIG